MVNKVTYEDLSISSAGDVLIKNHDLANALLKKPKETLESLKSTIPSIELSQISIDKYGIVVIDNEQYAGLVKSLVMNSGPLPAYDSGCVDIPPW